MAEKKSFVEYAALCCLLIIYGPAVEPSPPTAQMLHAAIEEAVEARVEQRIREGAQREAPEKSGPTRSRRV